MAGAHCQIFGMTRWSIHRSASGIARQVRFSHTQIFREVPPLRQYRRELRLSGKTVGLVPTMGALHDGHLSLIRQAARENSHVFVSVYVNPTQFGMNEDLDSYPRTWDADLAALKTLDEEFARSSGPGSKQLGRVTAIFAPTTKTMYPTLPPSSDPVGNGSFVIIKPLSAILEGASRPVFFRGVATVCTKLFNIIAPDRVYFGQKDVQQTVLIKRMVKDFWIDTEVKIGQTVREHDGLAMSSRNVYLGERRRRVATVLYRALKLADEQYRQGKRSRDDIVGPAMDLLRSKIVEQEALGPTERALFTPDYISLAHPDTLEELGDANDNCGAILSGAIKMHPLEAPQENEDAGLGGGAGPVRLIDNLILPPSSRS